MNPYRFVAFSDHWTARFVRQCRRSIRTFSLPAPKIVVKPLLAIYLASRFVLYFIQRVFIAEPIFKAYCTKYGKGLRTDKYIHWVAGKGRLIIGDHVLIDGKCDFNFAARFSESPTLEIGDYTGLNHNVWIAVGKLVSIGKRVRIASDVVIFDSSGHTVDPKTRAEGAPPNAEDVRPVRIEDNVWIGRRAMIFPGVTVGRGSIISAGSVVMSDVAPYTIVAGNPARRIGSLTPTDRPEVVAQT